MAKLPPHVVSTILSLIYDFQKDIKKGEIQGCKILDADNVEFLRLKVQGPDSTPYSNGVFELKLVFSDSFPQSPPKAYFKTPIFHPNVQQTTGEICISSLKKDWKPNQASVKNILLCIFSLLHFPNPQSALNADAASLLQENYEAFCARAKSLTNIHARHKHRPNKKLPDLDESFQKILSMKTRKRNTLNRSVGKHTSNFVKARKSKGKKKKSLRRL